MHEVLELLSLGRSRTNINPEVRTPLTRRSIHIYCLYVVFIVLRQLDKIISSVIPANQCIYTYYSALQVSCLAGIVNEQLSMSLYKLIAFMFCTITELST